MYQENRKSPLLMRLENKIQYLCDNCSLTWLGYVFTPVPTSLFKRLFWLVTITACCACSALVLGGALTLYTSDAVSYSVETDYIEWDTPFPALTICELKLHDHKERIKKYLDSHNLPSSMTAFAEDVSFWNPKFCKPCTTCEVDQSCIKDFMDMVHGIRVKCGEMLTDCWWGSKSFPCCERFHPIATEYGICFVFNSRLTSNETIISVNRNTGLQNLVFTSKLDIFIRIHSSDEVISAASDILSRCSNLPLISDFDVTLKAEQTISDVSVQRLSPDNRDCLFSDERPAFAHLWPFQQYSFSACVMYARAITQAEACNCSHHFMPQIGNIPKCGIEGLACLSQTKASDLSTDRFHCPMACEEVVYKVIHVNCSRKTGKLPEELTRRGTRGHMRLGILPSLRVRRHAIRELLGLVVDIGGVIGVFFGASLLSFIEIFYILFIRKYI